MKKRTWIAALCVAGTTVPALAGALFLAGCCVLPFHGVIHKILPLCQSAAKMAAGDHHDGDRDDPPSTPAREKEQAGSRTIVGLTSAPRIGPAMSGQTPLGTRPAQTAYRSFISLGATRCDRDVGLNVLVQTFLI
ncbi:MAG TPA: hypothetical protein VFO89_08390 [Thermoanaerobaculia bacterium]|nr:hypothetical protein [Thermoanaerobaculia bacterium]